MSVLKKTELMERIKAIMGDKTDDDSLQFIEDVNDTFDSLEKKTGSDEDWEAKYKENDEKWRKRYRDKFFSTDTVKNDEDDEDDEDDIDYNKNDTIENQKTEPEVLTYEALFEESEDKK